MIRPPPSSTLFPYTPLSRSLFFGRPSHTFVVALPRDDSLRSALATVNLLTDFKKAPPLQLEQDRKSTRLNSSHGYISYAVFCLKKKKKQIKTRDKSNCSHIR